MINLRGTGVALVTPMLADGQLDIEGLENIVEHVIPFVDYIVALGTTGEVATLKTKEKALVTDTIIRKLGGRKPLILGHGGNDTGKLVSQLNDINFTGIDGILSVSPYYNKPSQSGIIAHYDAIANASPVPVILYNVPGRTGSNISAASTLELSRHHNIIGTKEASGNVEQAMAIARDMPAGFYLISGDDLLTPALISIGAKGVISVLANAYPQQFSNMVAACLKNDFMAASFFWKQWLDINPLLYEEGNPVGIKAVLAQLGVCGPGVRLPLMAASTGLNAHINSKIKI